MVSREDLGWGAEEGGHLPLSSSLKQTNQPTNLFYEYSFMKEKKKNCLISFLHIPHTGNIV